MATYDAIGNGYAATRQPDPRIAARLLAALGGAESVVNVGAGAGSYEPPSTVVAVEPSPVMVAQRGPGAAPAVLGVAERLPLRDGAVDAAMAVLTIHHWQDVAGGLAELARVARRRVVILTWDHACTRRFWLFADYVPAAAEYDRAHAVRMDLVAAAFGRVRVEPLPVPADCADGFAGAFWRRPQHYLRAEVRRGMSVFAQLGEEAVREGLTRLEADLADGTWQRRYQRLTELDELDLGYRIVVADL